MKTTKAIELNEKGKIMKKMKIGSIVRLKQEAINEFYGTGEAAENHVIGGDLSKMTSQDFLEYVTEIVSFEDGVYGGIVKDIVGVDSISVSYLDRVSGGYQKGIYSFEDLEVVME